MPPVRPAACDRLSAPSACAPIRLSFRRREAVRQLTRRQGSCLSARRPDRHFAQAFPGNCRECHAPSRSGFTGRGNRSRTANSLAPAAAGGWLSTATAVDYRLRSIDDVVLRVSFPDLPPLAPSGPAKMNAAEFRLRRHRHSGPSSPRATRCPHVRNRAMAFSRIDRLSVLAGEESGN